MPTTRSPSPLATTYESITLSTAPHEVALRLANDYRDRTLNEADTRHRIIDEVLHAVLSWPRTQVECEHYIDPGFADYLLRKPNGDPLLFIEAKREGHYFELPSTFSSKNDARHIPVRTLLTDSKIAVAMAQVVGYCTDAGCEFAAITNGHTWIFFKVFERGKSWRTLKAFVVATLDYFSESFAAATNKLGYRSIVDRASLSRILLPAVAPQRTLYFPKEHIHAYNVTVTQNRFAPKLRPLVERYFGVIHDHDVDFMSSCYVNNREYDGTHKGVFALIRDNLSPYFRARDVRDFSDDAEGGVFGKAVVRNIQRKRTNQVIVLFGGKGSGKSTFLRRLLLHRSPQYLAKRAVTVIVDLLDAPESPNAIVPQIWDQTIVGLDQQGLLQEDRATLLRLFEDRFALAARQVLAGLDPKSEAYNVRLNELLTSWLTDRQYCAQRLALDCRRRHKGVVVAIDNTDQFSNENQDHCFSIAREISTELDCLVIVSMREERYYTSKIHGILDAYAISGFHISSPYPELVFRRRIHYVQSLLEDYTTFADQFTDLSPRMLEDFRRLFAVFEGAFRSSSSPLSRFLAASAHGNIRLALDLFKGFTLSGYTNVDEMTAKPSWTVATHQAIKPMMIPDRFFYDEVRSAIPNLFRVRSKRNGSHFTSLRILQSLSNGESTTGSSYLATPDLRDLFLNTFDMLEDYEYNLDMLLRYGLVEANNRLDEFSVDVDAVRITSYGAYVARELSYYFAYLDLVCIDVGVFDEAFGNELAISGNEDYRLFRRSEKLERVVKRLDRVERFLQYLKIEEERENAVYMPHESIEGFSRVARARFEKERPRILRSAKQSAAKRA